MIPLGEFLRTERSKRHESLNVISERAKNLSEQKKLDNDKIGKSPTYFSDLENGRILVEQEYLCSLAQIYKTDTLLLLSFYSIEQSHVVVLDEKKDYGKVSFKGLDMQTCETEGTDYEFYLPKFRLTNSRLQFIFATIKPYSSRPPHSHEGEEIIECREGEGVVIFPKLSINEREKHLKAGQMTHFDSKREHSIENRTDKPALFLIVRLLTTEKV